MFPELPAVPAEPTVRQERTSTAIGMEISGEEMPTSRKLITI